ncbi:MAG TPA: hypothetical protein VNJ01_08295 [Bacteriovoracaceae bacterium]|nr:hypothetical protein [Bacteriovoracaceae bacterium]
MKTLLISLTLLFTQIAAANDIIRAIAESNELKVQTLRDGRKVLAAKSGMTLYTFDNDTTGASTCFGGCLAVWPVIATVKNSLPAPFSIHLRANGQKQISLENRPLYFYAPDKKPGDVKGDGVGGIWHLVEIRE